MGTSAGVYSGVGFQETFSGAGNFLCHCSRGALSIEPGSDTDHPASTTVYAIPVRRGKFFNSTGSCLTLLLSGCFGGV